MPREPPQLILVLGVLVRMDSTTVERIPRGNPEIRMVWKPKDGYGGAAAGTPPPQAGAVAAHRTIAGYSRAWYVLSKQQ